MPLAPGLRLVSAALLSALAPMIARATTFQTLVTFDVRAMGSLPADLSMTSRGKIYGVTEGGARKYSGGGVFAFNPNSGGKLVHTLHTFSGPLDGEEPDGALTQVPDGRLFGVTQIGGKNGEGTIYSIAPRTKTESVVYNFGSQPNNADGTLPTGQLARGRDGKLYGTATFDGLCQNCGLVFNLNPATGEVKTVYAFPETSSPEGVTFNLAGTMLYGVTYAGGTSNQGTVYSLDPATGSFVTLYSFPGGNGGGLPLAPPIFDTQGNAYGATSNGVIYELAAGTNAFTVLTKLSDSEFINTGLTIGSDGVLYGSTCEGGPHNEGVVFSVVPSTGVVTILHAFDDADGGCPGKLVLTAQGVLYGTTERGNNGGTIFSIKP